MSPLHQTHLEASISVQPVRKSNSSPLSHISWLAIYLFILKSISNKKVTKIHKVSGKVRNKETLRIKTLIRGQPRMDDT